jgi:hypothetical protein
MTPTNWPCPLPDGGMSQEYALTFDRQRRRRLLILPALFDEGNRLRRFTVEVMRRLDAAGIDAFLPDLPGCNESLQPLGKQTIPGWLAATIEAGRHFSATHALGVRGGCLFTPAELPALHYVPVKAASILRQMLRAQVLSSREAGREETRETLAEQARTSGINLAGYEFGADFYSHFEPLVPDSGATVIEQGKLGGSGLWLRAEPDEDATQADTLAAILTAEITA